MWDEADRIYVDISEGNATSGQQEFAAALAQALSGMAQNAEGLKVRPTTSGSHCSEIMASSVSCHHRT